MLQNLSQQVRTCHRHAEECRCNATASRDPALRDEYLKMEKRWLALARSYEVAERITNYINEIKRSTNKPGA